MAFSKGQIVVIYEDPLTEEKIEGQAKLLKRVKTITEGTERWHVNFLADNVGDVFIRTIKTPDHK